MSRLNPNAGTWVPSFPAPVPAPTGTAAAVGATPQLAAATAHAPVLGAISKPAPITTTSLVPEPIPSRSDEDTTLDDVDMENTSDCKTYSIPFLLQFQPICDTVPCYFPDVVRAPAPPRLGRYINNRLVYSVAELLQFQPLYQMLPSGIKFTETLSTTLDSDGKQSKTPSKTKKEKAKQKAAAAAAAAAVNEQLQYDPTLMCYFNPTEYAAALNMAVYGINSTSSNTTAAAATTAGAAISSVGKDASLENGKQPPSAAQTQVNKVDEAVAAKRLVATLLDRVVEADFSVASALQAFDEIEISCTHTLQEVIGLLFDRSIAAPSQCDTFAQLLAGIADRTPEFKEGAKTMNFRRILLTRCYEALIEEPESSNDHHHPSGAAPASSSAGSSTQHSWRRQCMLQNVCLIGELFRRQLLTENIMHVCVAMMLEDDVTPQLEIIEAACRLLALVGDLLDGSSPASRRTMDEYFEVLTRLASHATASKSLKETIAELASQRTSGWAKKRLELVAIAVSSSPAKTLGVTPSTPLSATSTSTSATASATAAPAAAAVTVAEGQVETVPTLDSSMSSGTTVAQDETAEPCVVASSTEPPSADESTDSTLSASVAVESS